MKKKMKNFITTALIVALSLTLAACTGTDDTETLSTGSEQEAATHKVTIYDGADVLTELEVADGARLNLDGITINGYTPEKAGFEFLGWFSTPSKSHEFDFAAVINDNVSIYAGFAAFQEDEREFFIVGAGTSNIMLASNWGGGADAFDDEHKLTKAAGENKHTITVDLMEGDEFQFVINSSWQNQRGFGYLKESKLDDGTAAFSGAGGLGDVSAKTMNIRVELSGNYTFTLTTYPAEDYYDEANSEYNEDNKESFNMGTFDRIDWVRNGNVEDIVATETNFYIKGAGITHWENVYSGSHRLAGTLEIYLKEGEEFLFISTVTQDGVTTEGTQFLRYDHLDSESEALFDAAGGMGNNMIAKAGGIYTFTLNGDVLSVTMEDAVPVLRDYYIDGTFLGEWGDPMYGSADARVEGEQGAGSNVFIGTHKLNETAADSGIFKIEGVEFAAGDEVVVQTYKRGAAENGLWDTDGNNLLGTYGYHSLLKNKADFDSEWDFNIKIRNAGTYNVTFDSYSMTILLELN
ncbi:MAG: SusF/SusE family outer membrane protein [Lachnospiraceae bacterium]|nr:SusF/SusE family outer membrane protein [Lachnospiraceae bacterium]